MRECPFGCGAVILPHLFACRRHWGLLDRRQQRRAYDAYGKYQAGRLTLDELRSIQQEIVTAAAQGVKHGDAL